MYLKLEDLSTEQKLGMVLCARRCNNPDDFAYTLELVRNHAVGCIQVPINDKTPELVRAIREAADYPVLIINDMEQGYPRADLPKMSAMTLAACSNKEYIRAFARGIVATASADGFSGTWCPVVDVLHCDGPCSVSRHFSDDPMKVAEAAAEISRVFVEHGFVATAKHYPGGNNLPVDTHMAEGFSELTEKELLEFDLVPYLELMKQGLLPSIMTGHRVFPNIDPERPASLSKPVIDIIRRLGFDGVAFTDSLAMMGILQKYGEENVLGMAIAAGNDIVLTNYRTPTKKCLEMLRQNYRDGMFTEERLDEAVRRVLALQKFVAEREKNRVTLTNRDLECLNNVTRDCITAITDEGVEASLGDPNARRLFVVLTELGFSDANEAEITQGKWYFPSKIADKIRAEFPNSNVVFLPEFAAAKDNDRVLTEATKYSEVVFVTFCTTSAYLGTDGLTRRAEALINSTIISGKVSAVLHFGNPYALKPIHHVPRRIFGYNSPDSQLHAIEVLSGKIPARGKLPFDIQFD